MTFLSRRVPFCVRQEEMLALEEGGSAAVLNRHLPHLIGINEDQLGNGIIRYYFKVVIFCCWFFFLWVEYLYH